MNINLIGSASYTGYGVVLYNIMKALSETGHTPALFPKGHHFREGQEAAFVQDCINKGTFLFDCEAPTLAVWHQFDLAFRVGRGHYAAYPFFEMDRFPDKDKHHLRTPDTLISSCKWASEIVKKETGRDSEVIPPGVDRVIFNPDIPVAEDSESTIFLNAGKWEVRKGHDLLIDAFCKAFSPSDPVELWMMCHNPFLNKAQTQSWHSMYLDNPMGMAGKVSIVPWRSTHAEVAHIMAQTDCGVFPSRAEGWNMELLEMMSMGKHVITTDYSAHTEFCTDSNSKLISIDDKESAYDGQWFFNQGMWAEMGETQVDQLVEHMKSIHALKQSGDSMINNAGAITAQQYSWFETSKKLEDLLLT